MSILVSVGILARNEETKIAKCIDSLLSGSLPRKKIEIFLLDSNSVDGTLEIAKRYPIKIYQLSRGSIGAAVKLTVKEARGKYCFIVGGDSTVPYDFIKAAVSTFEKESELGLLVGKRRECSSTGLLTQMYAMRFARDKIGHIKEASGNFMFDKEKFRKSVKNMPSACCAAERYLSMEFTAAGYTVRRIPKVGMVHDCSGETFSLFGYIKKHVWYAEEEILRLKAMGVKRGFRRSDPHVYLVPYTLFLLLIAVTTKRTILLPLLTLPYLAVTSFLFSKRLNFGLYDNIRASLLDGFLFYLRAISMYYYFGKYLFLNGKIDTVKIKRIK